MSTPFPKSKEKRPRSSSEPNKSFVKNVTSRMSGLLPATIVKWFSSTSSSNTNGSAQVADATDSSTEDEAPESPSALPPPAKKIRYTSPGEFSQRVPVETKCTSTNTESIDETSTVFSPIGQTNARRDNIFASTRVLSSNDDTVVSTAEETPQDTFFKPQHSVSAIEHSTAKRRKSLFGTPQNDFYPKPSQSNSGNMRDPYFKPSLLSSPFYVGRTMYGGATSSYLSPTFKRKSISLTNETSNDDSVTISHSARRVMDLLEHYSSPLLDAKRIPLITREPERHTPNKHTPNNSLQLPEQPYSPKGYSYKTQELYVPSVANILTIKRKSRLMDSTNAARQIIASHSSSSDYLPFPVNSGSGSPQEGDKLTTKMKQRLTRTNRDRNIEMESNSSDTVNLPNVVLQIDKDNLPKFTFGPSTSQPQSSSIQTPVIITPEALKKTSESDKIDFSKSGNAENDKSHARNNNDYYTFLKPVLISSEPNSTLTTPPKFSFVTPASDVEEVQEPKTKDQKTLDNNSQIAVENKLPVQKTSDWKCLDCWVVNKQDVNKCVCCGGKKPITADDEPKKCSICKVSIQQSQADKCTECEKKTNNIDNPFAATYKEANATKWKCNDCWIDNAETADKCVCCGAINPKKTTPAPVANTEKNVDSEWKCNDCWIKNKSTLTKCAACGGLKPGTQAPTFNFGIKPKPVDNQGDNKADEIVDSKFKDIAKAQSERWQCPLCMVRNESNRDTCICCEASKPDAKKETQTKFNFHQPSEITFKFGIQPNNQKSTTDTEPEECNMGEESETNNNILPKSSIFSFGVPANNVENTPESIKKTEEAPIMNFTFGCPKENQMSPVRNSIFGIATKPTETSKVEEKPKEVPQIFTLPWSEDPQKKNLGMFHAPATSQVAPEMPGLVPLQQGNQNSTLKKDFSFFNSSTIPTTTSEAKTQQTNFTFPSIMPTTNLFTTPTTTSAMSNLLNIPSSTTLAMFQKTNAAPTTTSSSFFQKSDTLPTLGSTLVASLFPKNESATTTTTSSVSMQPVFSFGVQGAAPQAEKPKFNFSFLNNKTETTPNIFKPTFGVSTDNNNSTNKFNLPSNSLTGVNSLNANTLNNNNQLNIPNALTTGNTLTTPSATSIFGGAVVKENMWPPSNNNMFATNTTTNGDQKPPFAFGTSTPFSGISPPFGSTTQQAPPNITPFGSNAQQTQPNIAPFGSTAQQAQPSNSPFGSTAQQPQPSNVPFGSTAPQAQPGIVSFGSTAPQAQPSNVPFGSAAPQAQPTNAPFGSAPQTQLGNALFGSTAQQAQPNNTPFGSTTQQPLTNNNAFGGSTQPTQPAQPPQNLFGIPSQTTTSQPIVFGSPLQNQTTPNIFGGIQVPNNPMPMSNMPMFGTPNPVGAPSFGGMNPPVPTFETSVPPPQQTPASFNFGGQPSTAIFGFGQPHPQPGQGAQQPEIQPGIYEFGATPQMQFSIGSAQINPTVRRVRKAMRRTQR